MAMNIQLFSCQSCRSANADRVFRTRRNHAGDSAWLWRPMRPPSESPAVSLGAAKMVLEASLDHEPRPGARPLHVVLRIAGTADRNGVRPVVPVEEILDREIEREVRRRL